MLLSFGWKTKAVRVVRKHILVFDMVEVRPTARSGLASWDCHFPSRYRYRTKVQ